LIVKKIVFYFLILLQTLHNLDISDQYLSFLKSTTTGRSHEACKENDFNRKEFPEALPRGFPLKISTPNLFRGLNIKFRILIPEGQNETSKIPLWLCLGDSSFQEIFYFMASLGELTPWLSPCG
jgi:hypothetical protein